MRAYEFVKEDREKLDEIAPLALGLYLAGAGLTAYDLNKIWGQYSRGEITGNQALGKAGISVGSAAAGGVAGKLVGKLGSATVGGGKAIVNKIGNLFKRKDPTSTVKPGDVAQAVKPKAPTTTATATPTAKPGSTIQTPRGPRVAGVDGKPTVIDPTKRGARADIAKIKKQAKKQPPAQTTKAAGTAAGAATKTGTFAKIGKQFKGAPAATGFAAGAATSTAADAVSDFIDKAKQSQAAKRASTGADYLYKGKQDIDKSKVVQIGKAKDGI